MLYLTGMSGSGKTSLLDAWVLPKLRREGTTVIKLRGFSDPAAVLANELRNVLQNSNLPIIVDDDLPHLFETALKSLAPRRLLIVFDQFEEFFILQDEKKRISFINFLLSESKKPASDATILLVFRAEYDGFINDLNLPTAIPGRNSQKVSPFSEAAARDFLLGSGLSFDIALQTGVLHEAAEIEEIKGLIRPITLNLCGLVLSRFATGVPREFRPGRMIRQFVHESIFRPEAREMSKPVLSKLISSSITKQPRTIEQLADTTSFSPRQVQGLMFVLAEPDRGLVRPLDEHCTVWEVSHDFLVPIIDSMLNQWSISALRRSRPWVPLMSVVALLLVFFFSPRFMPDPIRTLTELDWDASAERETLNGPVSSYRLRSIGPPGADSFAALARIPVPFEVDIEAAPRLGAADYEKWNKLVHFTRLRISNGSIPFLTDISMIRNLPRLHYLGIDCHEFTTKHDWDELFHSFVENVPASVQSVRISSCRELSAENLKMLPRSITTVRFQDDYVIPSLFDALPSSVTGLAISG